MDIIQPVRRSIEEQAISRVLEYLHWTRRDGRRIFPLTELSEATAIDPETVEAVMRELETTGPFDVTELAHGEIRWRVDGCVYDIDEWDCTAWILD
jgi:hypothetical protein